MKVIAAIMLLMGSTSLAQGLIKDTTIFLTRDSTCEFEIGYRWDSPAEPDELHLTYRFRNCDNIRIKKIILKDRWGNDVYAAYSMEPFDMNVKNEAHYIYLITYSISDIHTSVSGEVR